MEVLEINITIKYDKDMQMVSIDNDKYDSCTYCNIKSEKEIAKCVEDFINDYELEEEE